MRKKEKISSSAFMNHIRSTSKSGGGKIMNALRIFESFQRLLRSCTNSICMFFLISFKPPESPPTTSSTVDDDFTFLASLLTLAFVIVELHTFRYETHFVMLRGSWDAPRKCFTLCDKIMLDNNFRRFSSAAPLEISIVVPMVEV